MVGLIPAVRLLEAAVDYGMECVEGVVPGALTLPTPCTGWNLATLLVHLDDSVTALREAPEQGCVTPPPAEPTGSADDRSAAELVAAIRGGTHALLEGWRRAADRPVAVGGWPLAGEVVAFVGAVEIAVHGWDVAVTCGGARPIPASVAREMLRWGPLIADDETRPQLFAPEVPVPVSAAAGDRLVAFLGRRPGALPAPLS